MSKRDDAVQRAVNTYVSTVKRLWTETRIPLEEIRQTAMQTVMVQVPWMIGWRQRQNDAWTKFIRTAGGRLAYFYKANPRPVLQEAGGGEEGDPAYEALLEYCKNNRWLPDFDDIAPLIQHSLADLNRAIRKVQSDGRLELDWTQVSIDDWDCDDSVEDTDVEIGGYFIRHQATPRQQAEAMSHGELVDIIAESMSNSELVDLATKYLEDHA